MLQILPVLFYLLHKDLTRSFWSQILEWCLFAAPKRHHLRSSSRYRMFTIKRVICNFYHASWPGEMGLSSIKAINDWIFKNSDWFWKNPKMLWKKISLPLPLSELPTKWAVEPVDHEKPQSFPNTRPRQQNLLNSIYGYPRFSSSLYVLPYLTFSPPE